MISCAIKKLEVAMRTTKQGIRAVGIREDIREEKND
jgi:hypothetical protein